ncbi:uncharacterized protein LOC126740923 [Anthonomus grandis grandis]|uniref:uncharacterized protein LOC126740923 n=1 Tax=Anthonomus grandis grandis TaxID=2921223 RepID=UPI00216547DE|nr:uncharacterized protein LOC126740923 [Anthonomus grandis grandis]
MTSCWSEETTLKFVHKYRDRPCLWDTRSANYKNKEARDAAYKEIEETMGIEEFGAGEIKNKIRALRSNYSQEKSKIKDSMKSGAGFADIYVPSIKWFKEIDAFLRVLEENKRSTQDNFGNKSECKQEVGEHRNKVQETLTFNETTNPAKKPRSLSKLKQVSLVVKDLKKISETVTQEPATNVNQYVIFGQSVAAQLMALQPISAIQAQEQIQSILTKFKLHDLRANNNYSSSSETTHTTVPSYTSPPLQSPNEYDNTIRVMAQSIMNIMPPKIILKQIS